MVIEEEKNIWDERELRNLDLDLLRLKLLWVSHVYSQQMDIDGSRTQGRDLY